MKELRLWANYYYNMEFNVTHIIPNLNTGKAKNPFKSPTNDRHKIKNCRQSLAEMQDFDWEVSSGIGVVLGFNNLRAIDFDFNVLDNSYNMGEDEIVSFIKKVLGLLNLPLNYEWVTKTPSGGFHIIFFAGNHNFIVNNNKTKAILPNKKYYDSYFNKVKFSHMELRWDKHLVLPPSINQNGKQYDFLFSSIPNKSPLEISNNDLINLLNEICHDEFNDKSGYNLFISNYEEEYKNDTDWFWSCYGDGEYLDFFPICLNENETNKEIPDDRIK